MLFFLWWHTEKNLQLLGALPPDLYQGLCPWAPLGAYCSPQTPASFSSFFTFPQSHVWRMEKWIVQAVASVVACSLTLISLLVWFSNNCSAWLWVLIFRLDCFIESTLGINFQAWLFEFCQAFIWAEKNSGVDRLVYLHPCIMDICWIIKNRWTCARSVWQLSRVAVFMGTLSSI